MSNLQKAIYYFAKDNSEGNTKMVGLLGGKGAGLAEMCILSMPIPPGFTIITDLCQRYFTDPNSIKDFFANDLQVSIKKLEEVTGKKFGSGDNPLLVSVRSGAKISMPGMMDTILNLGINDEVVKALALKSGNKKFAFDSYRRFLEMYGSVVLEVPHYLFEEKLEDIKNHSALTFDQDLTTEMLEQVVLEYKAIIHNFTGHEFETDPIRQLERAIEAVFKSWNSPRAMLYRKLNNIDDDSGTAVNIQSMVFGNLGNKSATGVIFTRDPSTGENTLYGEFLVNAQGEDVVAGIRTPAPISSTNVDNNNSMQFLMPEIYDELKEIALRLESYFGDMQDIEFTVEEGKLYILQARNGKRSAAAAIKIAVDMFKEKILSKEEAIMRIEPESINQLLHTAINYKTQPNIIAIGLPASPGAATGIAVFSPYDAEELSHHHKVILVRNDTSPEDIKGMHVSKGIITARGGMTSHAAVVARGMGCPCVCGIKGLVVNEREKFLTTAAGQVIQQGDTITIDGSTGNIIIGEVDLIQPTFSEEFKSILTWSDEIRHLKVRANAETSLDARVALQFGAEGIGLCRTEHMFFDQEKIPLVREMIVAPTPEQKQRAIDKLKPLQKADFKQLFAIMEGKPVNIRLLDPPLHEFLPTNEQDIKQLAETMDVALSVIEYRLHALHEINPMLGHRGCRLGITGPEIYLMQVEAIVEAVLELYQENGILADMELMIPLISDVQELRKIKSYINEYIALAEQKANVKFKIKIGTMIELPRAAITADKIAKEVDYFSFGTNDLTQTTFGISRDDIGSFLPDYLEAKIFKNDPFIEIDREGVGELVEMAVKRGKEGNHDLYFGVCGEHAGNPRSIDFFQEAGLDYVSCSPYRVPIARVAAAQSKIKSLSK